jgi:hypothetical protein
MAGLPFTVSIKDDFIRARAKLSDLAENQIPFAASQAANRLAKIGLADVQAEMQRVFDRPKPFTIRGFYARLGTKRDPHGEILARSYASKGTPAGKYLLPETLGGERHLKRFERALGFRAGEVEFTIPGRGAPLDQYGNITQGQINKILAALGAAETHSGYKANSRTRGRTARGDTYFLAHSKQDGSLLGVWKVVSTGHVEPVLIFSKTAPRYSIRFRFGSVVMQSVKKNSAQVFDEELSKAIATAR